MLMKNAIAGGAPMAHVPRKQKIKVGGVFGMGTNDADYRTQVKDKGGKYVWECPYRRRWIDMLRRCYSESLHNKYPTYKNCTACNEWLLFSNFREWMVKQEWEDRHLDKDIIGLDGQYSPENCRFIDHDLNSLLNDSAAARGDYPCGVSLVKRSGKFAAQISIQGKVRHLGYFLTTQEASAAYVKAKRKYILEYAHKQTDPELRDGLIRHANNLTTGES